MIHRIAVLLALLLASCTSLGGGDNQPTPGPTPTLRVLMQANDPATVELAAGKPQLIDFFAYW